MKKQKQIVTYSFRIDTLTGEKIDLLSEQTNRSPSDLIRSIILEYFKDDPHFMEKQKLRHELNELEGEFSKAKIVHHGATDTIKRLKPKIKEIKEKLREFESSEKAEEDEDTSDNQ